MTHHHIQATNGSLQAALVQSGEALYQSQQNVAANLALGTQDQTKMGSHSLELSRHQVQKALNAFQSYENEMAAMAKAALGSSIFSWVMVGLSVIASAFAGPEMLAMTLAFIVLSKTGVTQKAEDAMAKGMGNFAGSHLVAGLILTAAACALGGAGGAAMAAKKGAEKGAEEAVAVTVKEEVEEGGEKGAESLSTKIGNKVRSVPRPVASTLNALGQGLTSFNVGSYAEKAIASIHAKWATALGITVEVLIDLLAMVAQGVGSANGMMRESAAGRGLVGSSLLAKNTALFKGVGAVGTAAGLGEASCGTATGVYQEEEASSLHTLMKSEATSEFLGSMKDFSHAGFSSWLNNTQGVMTSLSKDANAIAEAIPAANTQLSIAMSSAV